MPPSPAANLRHLIRRLFGGTVPPAVFALPPGERIYAVGDIHGRLDLLTQMQTLIARDAAEARVRAREVFLGDYVDRGPDSRGVIDALLTPSGRPRILLRGNHEETLAAFLEDPGVLSHWRRNGADATLASYGIDPDRPDAQRAFLAAFPARHRRLLDGLATMHRAGDVLFVHAGIRPGVPLEAQHPADLTTIRRPFLDHSGPLPVRVVHGHTPRREPYVTPYRIGIDTGAFATGVLTCAVMERTEVRFLFAQR